MSMISHLVPISILVSIYPNNQVQSKTIPGNLSQDHSEMFNVFVGRRNYLLKWRGPFKRSDVSSRYPGMMANDTKRYLYLT